MDKQSLILVTGPARSGKSEWAENLAQKSGQSVIYIATSTVDPEDVDWQNRVQQHQCRRPANWQTLAVPIQLTEALQTCSRSDTCLLIDSLGTWLANLLDQDEVTWEKTLTLLINSLKHLPGTVIFVAEETGWGVVPAYPIGRVFRDRLGTLTRQIGSMADIVYLVTGGHVLNLSQLGSPLINSIKPDL
ncbi:MAG: bifunctional adenosylcobinamide kinase/adenosylcobinamide-phosphate guanylyltransferase [Oscillatoriales cyanobacterium RM1_1_9]|nr:bifunctional adenosylcobinamide kinase/adenosylcobinamide-phosphate guanylyltransferase [Oscillatoriales cyanobacterium SM2_3_0]NJO44922.1 bifunctional adenosylcobinamide kinase/adenosylcobinamide-phosphate guanylyltransferase [Oscillatoriales cyanobacterium RM2_1_1]NJO70765.1 bifunctional adenosylcobinamide kinase/adenosylcobinamide-phosphate guanylyltransferase [Oscillatoriales cyanobacterium RM1_1_9]